MIIALVMTTRAIRNECTSIIFLSSAPASEPMNTNSAKPPGGAENIDVTTSHLAILR